MNTAEKEKLADYNHLILYAKGWYHKGNVIEDVKKILGERCAIDRVSDENMWGMVASALIMYAKPQELERYIVALFNPIYGESRHDDMTGVFVWFTDTCPLERAIRKALSVLGQLRVIGEDKNVILNLGEPNPKILPLSNPKKSCKQLLTSCTE